MRKQLIVLGTLLTLTLSIPAFAAGRGGGAGGGFGGGGFGVGGASGVHGNFGGQSRANIGAEGRANTNGQAQANAASELGKLNAAHASATARGKAAPNSAVGIIATYDKEMNAALAINDPMARNAAIVSARQNLALNSNKQLTPTAAARIDSILGISGAPPNLGTTP
jgi:hypothetical protein